MFTCTEGIMLKFEAEASLFKIKSFYSVGFLIISFPPSYILFNKLMV
mgnify:CR=1 FL=1